MFLALSACRVQPIGPVAVLTVRGFGEILDDR
jgi:hypothetical protein